MLVVPYSTDAPLYHYPITTGVVIILNIVIFCLTTLQVMLGNLDVESMEWLILDFGMVNPLQWVTAAFMHGDVGHLVGNMFFLWAFGLIVEGKLGSKRFAILYLVLCLCDGMLGQVPMFVLVGEGGALGASGVIFALMVIAAIWAPENEVDCFYWVGIVFGTFEVRLVKLCGAYLFMQIFFLWLSGFSMSSEMLHMIGAFVGVPAGFFILRQGWVDCEGWDLVSRNTFLQDYDLLYSPEQRRRRLADEEAGNDPIKAALKLQANPDQEPIPMATFVAAGTTSQPSPKSSQPGILKGIFKGKGSGPKDAKSGTPKLDVKQRSEFQAALDKNDLNLAVKIFSLLDSDDASSGIDDELLFQYIVLLGKHKAGAKMIRPLVILGEHGGKRSDDAWLKLAHLQVTVMNQPHFAIKTLANTSDFSNLPAEAKAKKRALKNQLQTAAQNALGRST